MHVKKGDIVKVIAGKDKDKIGPIIQILMPKSQVVVKGVNIKTKHLKPQKEGEVGKIKQVEFPIHSSNVMIYSSSAEIASRVRYVINDKGEKVRQLIKNNEFID
uniref:Large ribosomal subunit protein uL24c n=1 Tax=Sciadococcus taiwanensis TaxID=3028030 RepID=A0A9Y1MWU3_9RHOD|nr:ribosomal protein L24 [Sciadococcus taiwanensis]